MAEPLIHVVDDDAALRASVVYLLGSVGWQACEYLSAETFLAKLDRSRPGCALLDVRMPGMSGLELQRALRAEGVELPVIFITGHGDVSLAVQAMKEGAVDMLEKPFRDQVLLDTVASAVRSSVAAHEARGRQRALASLHGSLTPRECQVARLVGQGLPNKRIARDLAISEKTVHIHRAHVMEKMGVHSAAELALLLMTVDPDFPAPT